MLLVLGSNRGLCGGYNASILREANQRIRQIRTREHHAAPGVVRQAADHFFRYQGIKAEQTYTQFEDKPRFDEVEEIANRYIEGFISGKFDRVEVAYMKFLNAARQTSGRRDAAAAVAVGRARQTPAAGNSVTVEYEFLPSAADILQELLPVSFKVRLFKCFLDAAVSEQIARRVTMKQATENADDMIKSLTRQYNRARQAQITKEIAEVIGGAAALE